MYQVADPRDASVDELEALFEEFGHGLSQDVMEQKKAPLGEIETAPGVFQFRDPSQKAWKKEKHVKELVTTLKRQEAYFDPILLFPINGFRLVLDGHCRLEAYRTAGLDEKTRVPITYFQGSFSEALTHPASENSKNKLPLTHEEKLEAAWRLVLYDEDRGNYSLREVSRVSGVGKSTVGNMRAVLRDDGELGFDPRRHSWKEVKRGRAEEREVPDDWQEKRSRKWAYNLRKTLGRKPNETPECLFHALEEAYPQLFPSRIPRAWAEGAEALAEILEECDESAGFKL